MIVAVDFAVVTTWAAPKRSNFPHQSCLLQVTQGIVDGGETNSGHRSASRLENLSRGRMRVAGANHIEHDLALTSQSGLAIAL